MGTWIQLSLVVGGLMVLVACGTTGGRIEVTLVNDSLGEVHMWAFDEEIGRNNRLGFAESRTVFGSVDSVTLEAVPVFVGQNGTTLEETFCTFDLFCEPERTPVFSAIANYNGGRFECVETSECRGPGE